MKRSNLSARRIGRKPRLLALFVLAAVALVACSSGASSGGSTADSGGDGGTSGNSDLPTQELTLSDGTNTTIPALVAGRPLVVNFFASWCPPCRAEMPDLQAVFADVEGRVDFVGVDLQDTEAAAEELIELTGVTYPWGSDPNGTLYAGFNGFAMPTTVYITADGEVAGQDNGPITEDQLRDRLDEFFGVQA